jgi:hypothetical protein
MRWIPIALAALALAAGSAGALDLVALGAPGTASANQLFRFDSESPGVVLGPIPIVGDVGGVATPSTLYGIVAGGDRLVLHSGAPGFATHANVGALGVDTSTNVGFDIGASADEAFAVLQVGGVPGLYAIDLATGAAALIGTVGDGTRPLAGLTIVGRSRLEGAARRICGAPPRDAAVAAALPSITPAAPAGPADCPSLCGKWRGACRGLVGAARSCWKNAGNRIAKVRAADCSTLAGDDREACRDALAREKLDLKTFLAEDGAAGVVSCEGPGLAACLVGCS